MIKINITLSLLFISSLLISQTIIKGRIIDNQSNKPLKYTNINIINSSYGIISDELGFFTIRTYKNITDDSIRISSIGYMEKIIVIKNLKKENNLIKLKKREYTLSEISIGDKKSININIGARKKKRKSTFNNCSKVNMQVALFIEPHKYDDKSFLKEVSFYINNEGIFYTPFRVRIYNVDTLTGKPKKDILYKSIIVKASKANSWVNVNLEDYYIPLPKEGFFVSMEWLYVEGKSNYLRGRSRDREKMCFGQRLSMTKEFDENLTWTKIAGIDWLRNKRHPNKKKFLNAAIGVTINQIE